MRTSTKTLADPDPAPRALEGFDLVDRLLERARKHANARADDELLQVGRLCEEVLFALTQVLYRPALHEPRQGPKPGASAPKRLEAYIDVELAGPLNTAERTLARTNLQAADSLQQLGTADVKTAALCLQATTSLVNVLRIAAGQQDVQYTIADLIERSLEASNLGTSHRYTLESLRKMEIAKKLASKLTAEDLIEHCQIRRKTVAAATVNQEISYLRGVLTRARDVWNMNVSVDAFEHAKRWLHRLELVGKSTPRTRRPSANELDRLLGYFESQDRDPRARIPMKEILLFALYSGRRIGDICRLKWTDLDDKRQPIVGPAREIAERQPKLNDRIFPYNAKSAGARYTLAKHALGIKDLRFQDLRREAAIRLYYKDGYSVEEISRIIGRVDLNSLRRDIAEAAADFENEPSTQEGSLSTQNSESPAEDLASSLPGDRGSPTPRLRGRKVMIS